MKFKLKHFIFVAILLFILFITFSKLQKQYTIYMGVRTGGRNNFVSLGRMPDELTNG